MEKTKLDKDYARVKARKAINSYPPQRLKKTYAYPENVYIRGELVFLYNYTFLREMCGLDMFTALGCVEDDQFWFCLFPDTVHSSPIIDNIPLLAETPELLAYANAIRRRHLVELYTLEGLIDLLRLHTDTYSIRASKINVPANAHELFEGARRHVIHTIADLDKQDNAEFWLSRDNEEYSFDWLKREKGLDFLDPACIELSTEAVDWIFKSRSNIFCFNPENK